MSWFGPGTPHNMSSQGIPTNSIINPQAYGFNGIDLSGSGTKSNFLIFAIIIILIFLLKGK